MRQIEDSFPLEEYINNSLIPGQVITLWCSFTRRPKNKHFILISPSSIPMLFIINSQISRFAQQNEDLFRSQIEIKADNYGFLDHNSYVDCSKIINHFTLREIKSQIRADRSRIKELITEETKNQIIEVIRNSRLMSRYNKEAVITALETMT